VRSSASTVPRAVLLDALGTLLELQPPAPRLRVELASRFAVDLSEGDAQRAIAAEIAYYRAHLDEGSDLARVTALRRRCADALHAALPESVRPVVPDGDGLVAALLASLRFRPYDDAGPALAAYRSRGLRLIVVSNWDVSLHGVLGRLGLGPLLDGVLTSAEVGARKPSPVIFEAALGLAGVPAAAAIHVGDSVPEDVEGARAAGIEPVLVRREGGAGPPGVRTVSSLAEVLGR
jgi:putative hydrolase of the HAD superfamily